MAIFTYVCMPCFSSLVSTGPQEYIPQNIVAHNPMLDSKHLNFSLVTSFIGEHAQDPVLFHSKGQCLMYLVSSLFSWLMDGDCLSCLVVRVRGTLPVSSIKSLMNITLNSQCDNFEPQEARMIKLL